MLTVTVSRLCAISGNTGLLKEPDDFEAKRTFEFPAAGRSGDRADYPIVKRNRHGGGAFR
jgi:hypothetical protein